jgi:NAD(P)-dependent dehydrogenase (short-subunit alcohol dehydrogenase family)
MARPTFNGKNVYIFGGSSGIGLETAKLLAQRGSNLILFARNRDRLERAVEEVSGQRLARSQTFTSRVLDVSDRDAVDAVVKEAVTGFGVPQIVVNAAGRAIPRHFEEITQQQFDETMKINLYGVWNTVSAVLPFMKERGGTIVNTSSVGGFVGVFGYADYAASKFAVIGLSEVLRAELKKYGINVAVLCPPDTDTPGFEVENLTKPAETMMISEGAGLMLPVEVARALLSGIECGDPVIVPGFEGRLTWFMKRHVPALVDFVMERGIRKAQRKA